MPGYVKGVVGLSVCVVAALGLYIAWDSYRMRRAHRTRTVPGDSDFAYRLLPPFSADPR
jgi:uncharacterized membrane protein YjgN (DUF898 family)